MSRWNARGGMTTAPKTLLVVLALAAAVCAFAGSAQAATFGQIGSSFGKPGVGAGEFHAPGLFGVDPVDGSIYVGDITPDENNYRIQKFSNAGMLEASVLVPRKIASGSAMRVGAMHGIAIDSARHRFYLVQACRLGTDGLCALSGKPFRAIRIFAFSTEPSGGQLVKTGEFAVSTADAEAVLRPQTVAVEPVSGDLFLAGEDAEAHAVIERLKADGSIASRFVDTANRLQPPAGTLFPTDGKSTSITVANDGTVYTLTSGQVDTDPGEGTAFQAFNQAWTLPSDLSKVEEIPAVAAASQNEGWANVVFPQPNESTSIIGSPQIAVSPDGKSLYWKEELSAEATGEPSVVVRAFSLATGATEFVYGGGSGGRCEIESTESALAATSGNKVVVFDFVNLDGSVGPEGRNAVLTFGPGGDSCGSQEVRFNVDGSAPGPVQVDQGAAVELDASESVLIGQVEGLEWEFGDGSPNVVVPGPAPSLKTTHVFEKATKAGETFAVTLKVKIKGASAVAEASVEVEVAAGVPAPPRAFIEVLEPSGFFVAAGGTMRFDASQSWDPIGGTNLLKKYVWSFGDGSPDVATTAPSVVHTFANPGGSALQRLVVLTVESASGGTNSDRRLITVLAPPGSAPVPPGSADVAPPSTPPSTGTQPKPKPKPGKKPLTAKQRRQKAIAKCKKLPAGSRKRQGCLKRAARIGKETGGKKKGSGS